MIMNGDSKVLRIKDAILIRFKRADSRTVMTCGDIAMELRKEIEDLYDNDERVIDIAVRILFDVDMMKAPHFKTEKLTIGYPVKLK